MELKVRIKDQTTVDGASCCDRQQEIDLLERRVEDLTDRLITSGRRRTELEKIVHLATERIRQLESAYFAPRPSESAVAANHYEFEDDDLTSKAFDDFLAASDPHLEKSRRFFSD